MQVDLTSTSQHLSFAGVVLLLGERVIQLLRYRNGSSRRLTEDKVRLIVQEEIAPVNDKLSNVCEKLASVASIITMKSFRANG